MDRGRIANARLGGVVVMALLALSCGSGRTTPRRTDDSDAPPADVPLEASLKVLTDAVTVAPTPVASGGALHEGDVLTTDEFGLAEVDYSDDSYTRVRPSSTFTLTRLSDEAGVRQVSQHLSAFGATYSRVAKLAGSDAFDVDTDQASAAVRGSVFAVLCIDTRTCEFAAIEDVLLVTAPDGTSVTLDPGEFVVVTDGVIGPVTTTASPEMAAWIALNQELDAGGTPPPPPAGPPRIEGTFVGTGTVTLSEISGPFDPVQQSLRRKMDVSFAATPRCGEGGCTTDIAQAGSAITFRGAGGAGSVVEITLPGSDFEAVAEPSDDGYRFEGVTPGIDCFRQVSAGGAGIGGSSRTGHLTVILTPLTVVDGAVTSLTYELSERFGPPKDFCAATVTFEGTVVLQ